MKFIKIATFIISWYLLFVSCNNRGKTVDNSPKISQDSIALINLVRQVYKWHETIINKTDFEPKTNSPSDTLYSGIDWNSHNAILKAINTSNYFDKTFADSYQNIALHIDDELQTGKTFWVVGELSPFGTDTNPWCNCQDYPDNYWDKILISNVKVKNDKATFSWTWGDNYYYIVKAKKNNGTWKISYLEGFDNYAIRS